MEKDVKTLLSGMQSFFRSGATKDLDFRKSSLRALRAAISTSKDEISRALYDDLRKSPQESYISEISIVLSEIDTQISRLGHWAKGRRVGTPLFLFPSSSRILYEPKGVILIIAPWNYPFQLAVDPLVGAIAAGNCVVIKPSTTSGATCAVLKRLIADTFPANYVTVMDGDHDQTALLLKYPFDHIFFTGGTTFGRTVMQNAAENLVPVTLELGGKSPCVVDRRADLKIASRRIVWGKLMNAGQTCIAPDYLLVHISRKEELVSELIKRIGEFYGEDMRASKTYPRIISDKAFDRLNEYLEKDKNNIIYGGEVDRAERYIAPTILDGITARSAVMQEEIFGPIFPIITYENIEEAIDFINAREKPLALYYFGRKKDGLVFIRQTTSGGVCINDTIVHIANNRLPFGGVGFSGMGRYHGRHSFETFSNSRATVISRRSTDIKLRYPPYGKNFKTLRKLL